MVVGVETWDKVKPSPELEMTVRPAESVVVITPGVLDEPAEETEG